MKKALLFIICLMFTATAFAEERIKVYIDVPNPCVRVNRIEDNKIYLVTTNQSCIQVMSKMQVEVLSQYKNLYVYVDEVFWKKQRPAVFDMNILRGRMDEAEKLKEKIEVPKNIHKEQGAREARNIYGFFKSEEFQKKLEAEKERLKETIFKDQAKAYGLLKRDYYKDIEDTIKPMIPSNERIYVFISSSVPISTLRNYAAAIERLNDPNISMIMRGFIGGMERIQPTMDFIADVLKKDRSCDLSRQECETFAVEVLIDPLLFRKYNITNVPAVVYARGISIVDEQISEGSGENVRVGSFYTVYGDMSLNYILERIYEETKSSTIKALLNN